MNHPPPPPESADPPWLPPPQAAAPPPPPPTAAAPPPPPPQPPQPPPAAVPAPNPTTAAVHAARAAHFALPPGWVPNPVERRPIYTGARCPDPLRGLLIARDVALRMYVVRVTLATRAWGWLERLVEVPPGKEVVIVEDIDLMRLAPLLARPDVFVEIDIRNPRVVERRESGLDVYAYEITMNPTMVPRSALGPAA